MAGLNFFLSFFGAVCVVILTLTVSAHNTYTYRNAFIPLKSNAYTSNYGVLSRQQDSRNLNKNIEHFRGDTSLLPQKRLSSPLTSSILKAISSSQNTGVAHGGTDLQHSSELQTSNNKSSLSLNKKSNNLLESFKTWGLVGLWWALNVGYNIENKRALTAYPLPNTVAVLQMFVGFPIFILPWLLGIRKTPHLYSYSYDSLAPFIGQGVWHALVHVSSVIALGAGAISFVHIVKAAEPVVAALLAVSSTAGGESLSPITFASLVPLVGGVGLASASELSFTWKAFIASMLSNIGSSLRGLLAKKTMKNKDEIGTNLTPANIYSILTILSTVMLIPVMLSEHNVWSVVMNESLKRGYDMHGIAKHILMSGLWYYLYNEVAFVALGRLNAISHAVANTLKRVALIMTSVLIFNTKLTPMGAAGSVIATLGAMLYSISKSKFG